MKVVALVVCALALSACGASKPHSAEQVARDWSAALDRNDNEAAARLFAPDATVVQNGELTLHTHADAVQWNTSLPCGGRIVSVQTHGADDVIVVFKLDERPKHACDGPGGEAAAIFRVRNGKIVLWHQTAPPASGTPSQVV